MAVDERRRNEVHEALKRSLGPQQAADLMSMLPPAGWGDVATKQDLEALSATTRKDIEALKTSTRSDIEALQVSVAKDLDAQSALLRKDMEVVEVRLRGEIQRTAKNQLFAFVTLVGILNGGMLALLKLA